MTRACLSAGNVQRDAWGLTRDPARCSAHAGCCLFMLQAAAQQVLPVSSSKCKRGAEWPMMRRPCLLLSTPALMSC